MDRPQVLVLSGPSSLHTIVEFYGLTQLMEEIVLQERGWKYHLLSDCDYYSVQPNLNDTNSSRKIQSKKDNNLKKHLFPITGSREMEEQGLE